MQPIENEIREIVVLGGGSAGWLTAAILASNYKTAGENSLSITLVESPEVKTIGVGEGTWPSMRTTLQKIGVSESEFMTRCDVSLKQGTRFENWATEKGDSYYHPFSLPSKFGEIDLAPYWSNSLQDDTFAETVCAQTFLCERALAPKQIQTPEYAFNVNYGYHLNAGKFGEFLREHCVENLGVTHVVDHVERVNGSDDGFIESLQTRENGSLDGDLFVDCSGLKALLIGDYCDVPFVSVENILFNNTAYAAQVGYADEQVDIASATLATAQASGWIWDIGLPTRRGVGYVCSSNHTNDQAAEQVLSEYIGANSDSVAPKSIDIRKIQFTPGYRKQFWKGNCVAIGLSAGFVEPLEASALVLVERSAQALADCLPKNREAMSISEQRFNQRFTDHWLKIINFLKLHYVLSSRQESDYWIDHRSPESIPPELAYQLQEWEHRSPWLQDAPNYDELFPAASLQYVLYGMGFRTRYARRASRFSSQLELKVKKVITENQVKAKQLVSALPSNRELVNRVQSYGFQKI